MSHFPTKYNEKFLEALARLNPGQLDAVNQVDGPVLVVAGPGTGKTQILAARIGKILLETDTKAHEILCLTYTEAGVVAMRKRLFDFIGPEAYRVNIYTFHAFCNDIIQDNLDYFGRNSLEAISDLDSVILLRQLIDEFPIDHPLKRFSSDPYLDLVRLKRLFSVMKQEHWDEDFIKAKVAEYLDDLPNREEYRYKRANSKTGAKAGDLKQKGIDAQQEVMKKLLAGVAEFARFDAKMKNKGFYDYDDMILWVLNAFRNDEDILRKYQERYQYILVDEFQDTSGSQSDLLKLLLNFWDTPNVFVVGDDDQSVFRFQGANMKNIVDFAGDYVQTLKTIVLKENYRSNQHILDVSRVLIGNNNERLTSQLKLDKNLEAAHPRFKELAVAPVICEYENPAQEIVGVANQIRDLIEQGTDAAEIAVIYRNHSQVEELLRYLDTRKIAVNTRRKINILALPFGEKIINILRYLAMELDTPYSGDELLFEIMHYDFFAIPPIEIAKASVAVSTENYKNSNKGEPKTSLRRYISEIKAPTQASLFDAPKGQEMKLLATHIDDLLKAAVSVTLQKLFEDLIAKMGILRYIMLQPDKGWYMQVLTNFFNFLKDESRKKPDIKVSDLTASIELMKKNNITLSLNQVIYSDNGVNFLTAHGSKGLEFEYVFLIGCDKKTWEINSSREKFAFPDTLTQSSGDEDAQLEESRRLFYVALTRAKQHLAISYPNHNNAGKDLEASRFVAEILAGTGIALEFPVVNEEDMFAFLATQFNEDDKPQIELIDDNYIDQLLQNYTLSVTHLNNYLECPLKFYFQCLIRVPSGKSPSATFGSAVHDALKKAFRKLKDDGDEFPPTKEFIEDFRIYMHRNRDSFTKEEFKLKLDYGQKILPPFYEQHIKTWNKVALVELPIKNIEIDGVPVKGNLDKVEFQGKQVTVVDYKTGNFKYAKDKLVRPGDKFPNGGDYWRQAVFYKLLIENDRSKDWQVIGTQFDFVEPDENDGYRTEKIFIEPQDIQFVREQISTVYRKIQAHDFKTGCGRKDCAWCHFVRSNYTQTSGIIESIEEV